MASPPFLRASNLALRGRLDGVSLDLAMGSTVAILGPSGSGKTSLMRLLAGFEAPHQGRIEIDGALASADGRVHLPPERRGLAFAFQEPALMPHLDTLANVHLGGARRSGLEAARQALIDVGLAGLERRRVWELSGGEAQRVQLARMLASDARLLLLDEPFASVDRMCRADLLSRIGARLRRGAGRGVTAIVTHDPADALELSDLSVVMRAGRIVACGSFERIAAGDFGSWPAEFLASGLAGRELR